MFVCMIPKRTFDDCSFSDRSTGISYDTSVITRDSGSLSRPSIATLKYTINIPYNSSAICRAGTRNK